MQELLEHAVNEFKKLDNKPIRIISHIDCDGLASASIITKTLERENKKFILSFVKQLNEDILKELVLENYNTIIFSDLGSGYINLILKYLKNKKIFIFDHHIPDNSDEHENIIHVNPTLIKITNLSGSGITYLFSKNLNSENKDLAYIAVIGTIGDVQEFSGLNNEILDDAKDKLEIKRGLKMFGAQTKPLYKVLQYSTEPFIPKVTGSEENAILFLNELGINLMKNNKHTKLADLNEDEFKKLTTEIILRRLGSEKNPEDVFGDIYLLKNEDDNSTIKDLREFSTLLNCCGRLNKPSIGIGVCLENKELREKSNELLKQYKLELIKGLEWFHENMNKLIKGKNYVIINAENHIRDTLIGTISSIISKSNIYEDETIILSMAYTLNNNIKVSMRVCNSQKYNLKDILSEIVKGLGEAGGHKFACGTLLKQEHEKKFIENAANILSKIE